MFPMFSMFHMTPDIKGYCVPRAWSLAYLGIAAAVIGGLYLLIGTEAAMTALCFAACGFLLMDLLCELKFSKEMTKTRRKSCIMLCLLVVAGTGFCIKLLLTGI